MPATLWTFEWKLAVEVATSAAATAACPGILPQGQNPDLCRVAPPSDGNGDGDGDGDARRRRLSGATSTSGWWKATFASVDPDASARFVAAYLPGYTIEDAPYPSPARAGCVHAT